MTRGNSIAGKTKAAPVFTNRTHCTEAGLPDVDQHTSTVVWPRREFFSHPRADDQLTWGDWFEQPIELYPPRLAFQVYRKHDGRLVQIRDDFKQTVHAQRNVNLPRWEQGVSSYGGSWVPNTWNSQPSESGGMEPRYKFLSHLITSLGVVCSCHESHKTHHRV